MQNLRDRVRNRSTLAVLREPVFRLATRMTDIEPADQLSALFLATAVAAEAAGLDVHEEVARAKRMIRQAEGPFTTHVHAFRDYVAGELRR